MHICFIKLAFFFSKNFLVLCHAEYIKMPCPLLIVSQSRLLIQIHILNDKRCRSRSVGYLDLHCLQTQGISGISRTRVNIVDSYKTDLQYGDTIQLFSRYTAPDKPCFSTENTDIFSISP